MAVLSYFFFPSMLSLNKNKIKSLSNWVIIITRKKKISIQKPEELSFLLLPEIQPFYTAKELQLILWRTKQKDSPRMTGSFLKINLNHSKIANRKPGWILKQEIYLMPFCSTDSSFQTSFKVNVQDRYSFFVALSCRANAYNSIILCF